jgi:hypothetical protein
MPVWALPEVVVVVATDIVEGVWEATNLLSTRLFERQHLASVCLHAGGGQDQDISSLRQATAKKQIVRFVSDDGGDNSGACFWC